MSRLFKNRKKYDKLYVERWWGTDLVSGFQSLVDPKGYTVTLTPPKAGTGFFQDKEAISQAFKAFGLDMKSAMRKIDLEIEKERKKQVELELDA